VKFHFDPTRPIYIQIMNEIKKRAVREQYRAGAQLPSVREMAKEMAVNPNTIDEATERFINEIMDIELNGGHRGKLIDKISDKLSAKQRKKI